MLKYSDGELGFEQANLIEEKIQKNTELRREYAINLDVDEYMRSHLLISEANKDPDFIRVETLAKNDVAEFLISTDNSDGLAFYIKSALTKSDELGIKIDQAEREMHLKGLKNETTEWVKSWVEHKDALLKNDKQTQEIFDFVRKGMDAEYVTEIKIGKVSSVKRLLFKISSAAAILIIAIGLWSIFSSKHSTEELFADYYQPYQVIDGQTRSENKEINQQFMDAVRHYKKEQFDYASVEFEKLLKIDKNSSKIILLFSITQIEQQNYAKAITGLNDIILTNGEFTIEAKWYLALCYLKTDQLNNAKDLLKELSVTPGYFKNKSAELLNEL